MTRSIIAHDPVTGEAEARCRAEGRVSRSRATETGA